MKGMDTNSMDKVIGIVKAYCNSNTKDKILTILLSLFFCLSIGIGHMVEKTGYLDLGEMAGILAALLLTPVVAIGIYAFYDWMASKEKASDVGSGFSWKCRTVIFLFLILCWGIVLLGVFPGFFLYDAQDELNQVLTRNFTTHHPLFHVLYMGGLVQAGNKLFGGYNAGICALMLFQMICFAAGFTYMVDRMKSVGMSVRYGIFTILFLGLFPVIPMMVLCSSKDALFSLIMVLWMVETYICQRRECQRFSIFWAGLTILLVLLRNNAIYALLALGVAVAFFLKKERKKLLSGLLISIVIAKLFSMGLAFLFHADSLEYQEILTVPIQQLTRTYHLQPELFSEEELEILYSYIPESYLEKYEPKLSDSVKIGFQNEKFAENKADFFKLWAGIGKKSPMSFVNAWLLTSYGYWYPDATVDVYRGHTVYTFTYGDSSYFGYETEQPGVRNSFIPAIDSTYRYLSLENWKEKAPVLYLLFSPGFMLWIQLFGIGFLWKKYGLSAILPYGCILFVVATLLLGPTFLPRYVFFLWPCNLFLLCDMKLGR